MKIVPVLILAAVIAAAPAAPVAAQTASLAGAIAAGQAGERYDGYMGVTGAAPAEIRRRVSAVNIKRRNLYVELSARRNVSAQVVGIATGCQLLAQVAVGQFYLLEDNVWRRREVGQPAPQSGYCR